MIRLTNLAAILAIIATALVTLPTAAQAAPGDAIVPGTVRVDATYRNIGVVWQVTGDANLDSAMLLEFRESGSSSWQNAAMAVRGYPSLQVNGSPLGLNQWGASAMFLQPATSYELRLTITDPDGGGQNRTVSATTRTLARPDPSGRQLYVVPGNGGGTGTNSNPSAGYKRPPTPPSQATPYRWAPEHMGPSS